MRSRGDNHIEAFMTQGESESPAEVVYLGRYVIHDVPHQASGMTVVNIAYHYDLSGTVKVVARPQGSTEELPVTVEDVPADVPDRFLEPPLQLVGALERGQEEVVVGPGVGGHPGSGPALLHPLEGPGPLVVVEHGPEGVEVVGPVLGVVVGQLGPQVTP